MEKLVNESLLQDIVETAFFQGESCAFERVEEEALYDCPDDQTIFEKSMNSRIKIDTTNYKIEAINPNHFRIIGKADAYASVDYGSIEVIDWREQYASEEVEGTGFASRSVEYTIDIDSNNEILQESFK